MQITEAVRRMQRLGIMGGDSMEHKYFMFGHNDIFRESDLDNDVMVDLKQIPLSTSAEQYINADYSTEADVEEAPG